LACLLSSSRIYVLRQQTHTYHCLCNTSIIGKHLVVLPDLVSRSYVPRQTSRGAKAQDGPSMSPAECLCRCPYYLLSLLFEPIIPAVDIETYTIGLVSVVLLCFTLVVHNSAHRNIIALPAYALLNASCFIKPPSRYEVLQCCSPRGRGSRHHNRWERNGDEVQAHRYSCRQLRCKTRYQPLFAPIKEHQYT